MGCNAKKTNKLTIFNYLRYKKLEFLLFLLLLRLSLFSSILFCKCVKKIQFVCNHKTQLSAKLSLFLSYNDMFRPTITAIVRLYMKPLTHMPESNVWMGWGVFSEISSGVILGEVCWYINMCELLVDYCNIASCCCLSQVVIMRAWAGCWLS